MFSRNNYFMFCSPKSDSSQDSEGESGDSRVLSQAEMAYIAIQVNFHNLIELAGQDNAD